MNGRDELLLVWFRAGAANLRNSREQSTDFRENLAEIELVKSIGRKMGSGIEISLRISFI